MSEKEMRAYRNLANAVEWLCAGDAGDEAHEEALMAVAVALGKVRAAQSETEIAHPGGSVCADKREP